MNFLYTMFSDINGAPSNNRFISTFVVVFPILVWAYPVIKTVVWVPIPDEILILSGSGLGSKIIQRKIEESGRCVKKEKSDGN